MHLEWLSLLLPLSSSTEYPYFLQTIDHHLTTFYWTFKVSQYLYVHTKVYCCESRLTRLCRTACDEAEAVKDRCREGKSVAGSRRVFAEEKSVTQRRQVSRVNAGFNSSEKQAVSHPRPRSRGRAYHVQYPQVTDIITSSRLRGWAFVSFRLSSKHILFRWQLCTVSLYQHISAYGLAHPLLRCKFAFSKK